jgi:hypothetical protein
VEGVVRGERTESLLGLNSHVPGDTGLALGVGHEAGVHAAFHLSARVCEGGLRHGVVLLHELEHDDVADLGGDGLGGVEKGWCHSRRYWREATNDDLRKVVRLMSCLMLTWYLQCVWLGLQRQRVQGS